MCYSGASPAIRNCIINNFSVNGGCAISISGNRSKQDGVLIQNCSVSVKGNGFRSVRQFMCTMAEQILSMRALFILLSLTVTDLPLQV